MQRIRAEPGAAQRELRDADAAQLRRAPGAARTRRRRRRCPCRGAGAGRAASWSSTSPTGTRADGMAFFAPLARSARLRRLRLGRRDPADRARAARSPATARRSRGSARCSSRRAARWSCPATGRRSIAPPRCGCSTRTPPTSTRSSVARSARALPGGRDTPPARDPRGEPGLVVGLWKPLPEEQVPRGLTLEFAEKPFLSYRRGLPWCCSRWCRARSAVRRARSRHRDAARTSASPSRARRASGSTHGSSSHASGASRPDRVSKAQLADAGRR